MAQRDESSAPIRRRSVSRTTPPKTPAFFQQLPQRSPISSSSASAPRNRNCGCINITTELQAKVALCAGATIDFLAGHRRRSPVWMRRAGLEWLHRVCSEPRRLASRYARDAWVFPQLVWQELRTSSNRRDRVVPE